MSSPTPYDVDVLVSGAGPAGLAAAIELSRRGVSTLLVERRRTLSSHPRATILSMRSMELVRSWGIAQHVRERSADVELRMLVCSTLAAADRDGEAIEVGYPSREQARVLGPEAPAVIAQDDVEPMLLSLLLRLPAAGVRLGSELIGLQAGADGARAALREVSTGERSSVRARYVVAADGAHSAIRKALGIGMTGHDGALEGATTLFHAPLWEVLGPHRHLIYSTTDPEAPAVFIPTGPSDRWLFGDHSTASAADESVADRIRRAAGVPDLPVRVVATRSFSAGAMLADSFRAGRVLLAGDAAHRVTPRGGTGLNLALHDGHDAGWRLAWVLRGWAGESLLDSYEDERRAVAEHTAARSADPSGSRRVAEQEVPADLGGRLPHAWTGGRSTVDLPGDGLTLIAAGDGARWRDAIGALDAGLPVDLQVVDPIAARAAGATGRSALLVRTDGRPLAAIAPAGAREALAAAVAAAAHGGRREPAAALA